MLNSVFNVKEYFFTLLNVYFGIFFFYIALKLINDGSRTTDICQNHRISIHAYAIEQQMMTVRRRKKLCHQYH
jgi:hypothetical protein